MKKLQIALIAIICTLSVASCGKVKGNLGEGIYQPNIKISKIYTGSNNLAQSWDWGTSKLSSIQDIENGINYSFSYAGDMLGNVTMDYTDDTPSQSIFYSYGGTMLTQVEIVEGTQTMVKMFVNHDADDHISTINLDISNDYLIRMAKQLLFQKSALSHVISSNAFNAMAAINEISISKKAPKYDVSNKHFTITYTWNGDNISSEVTSGNVSATATINDISSAFDLGSVSSLLQYFGSDTEYPLSCTVSSKTEYLYDDAKNPLQYCWANGIDATNLSRNNVTKATTTGSADATFTLIVPESIPLIGGMSYDVPRNIDLGETQEYTYKYNKKNYPESYTNNGVTHTYEYTK